MNEHDRRILAPKIKSVHSPELLGEFARAHWFCQVCGEPGDQTIHHIIGGRGGRSDEHCNLLSCCWLPCHSQFADHSINLPVILTMKLRAGELTEALVDRLGILDGTSLELAPIPENLLLAFERNRPEVMMRSAVARTVHEWSRMVSRNGGTLDTPPLGR